MVALTLELSIWVLETSPGFQPCSCYSFELFGDFLGLSERHFPHLQMRIIVISP